MTTIQLSKKTMDRLRELKIHPKESYDEVVARLLSSRTEQGEISEATIRQIQQGLEDIRAKRTVPIDEIKRQLDIL